MGFLSLDSKEEAYHFLVIYERNAALFDQYTHIGAVASFAKTLTDWYWVENAEKANFTINFLPGQPDNYGGNELCLVLMTSGGSYYFNDLKCYENYIFKFVCQTVNYLPSPTTTTELAPTTDFGELLLFSD
jgi:hypothetical protein